MSYNELYKSYRKMVKDYINNCDNVELLEQIKETYEKLKDMERAIVIRTKPTANY